MDPRLTRKALITLDERVLYIKREGRRQESHTYTRAKLTASTLSRLSRISLIGKAQLVDMGTKANFYVGLVISVEVNWSPAYGDYLERASEAHGMTRLTFVEYQTAMRCLKTASDPIRPYYIDLLFLERESHDQQYSHPF